VKLLQSGIATRNPGMAGADYGTYESRSMWGRPSAPGTRASETPYMAANSKSILRSGGSLDSPGAQKVRGSSVTLGELILVPWLFLLFILLCFLLGGVNGQHASLGLVPCVLVGLCVAFITYHYRRGNNAEVVMGILCLTAVMIGLVVGLYSVLRSLNEYHRLSQGASYFNVLPTESADSKLDATTLDFTSNTLVDVQRAYGYVDAAEMLPTTYCVAPVSNGEAKSDDRIHYWAAGTDCCESRGNFQCGAAGDPSAHGAIVLPKSVQQSNGFARAVRGAEHAYGLTASDSFLLVRWSRDPVFRRKGLWTSTSTLFLVFGGVYLIISVMIGFALMPVVGAK